MNGKRLLGILLAITLGGGGVLAGYGIGKMLKQSPGGDITPGSIGLMLGSVLLLTILAVALHEAGHIVGGRFAGFRFMLYIVGPLRVAREADGIRVGLNRSLNMGGGLALMLPPDGIASPGALARFIAGGPIASVLATLLFGAAAALAGPGTDLRMFLVIGLATNAGISLGSLLPTRVGGFDSDGRQLLDLRVGGHEGELRLLGRALTTDSLFGTRPRDWHRARLARLQEVAAGRTGPHALLAFLLAYYHHLDRGETELATTALARAQAAYPDAPAVLQTSLTLEAAYLAAAAGDAATARAHLASTHQRAHYVERHSMARVEAALLHLEGRYADAARRAREGLSVIGRALDRGGAVAEREWLERVAAEAERAGGAPMQPAV